MANPNPNKTISRSNRYRVILKSLTNPDQKITLSEWKTLDAAEQSRRLWRRALGGKNWATDRRPGMDTLDTLGLTVVRIIDPAEMPNQSAHSEDTSLDSKHTE